MTVDATKEVSGYTDSTVSNNDGFVVFGHALKPEFPFDPEWRNLNQGSFGSAPNVIMAKRAHYQAQYELRPDPFIRRDVPRLLDESRAAVAKLINAPVQSVVFVSNSTEGINTVLKNLRWNEDGKDVMIGFNTMYDACARAGDFVVDYFKGKVGVTEIALTYPLEDDEIIALLKDRVKQVEGQGKRARLALFDVVSSNPGVLFPWETMVSVCRELGIISLVDGAQSIGMVHLDMTATSPDFLVSSCHKWLHVPRGCAVFHVPERNQHLIPSSLGTSRGYAPQNDSREGRTQPMPDDGTGKNHFVRNFEWTGTRDDSPLLCVKDAIAWRRDVLGGEDRIIAYLRDLNLRGIRHIAEKLGTTYLQNKSGTLTNCGMGNVALPLWVGEEGKGRAPKGQAVLSKEDALKAFNWMQDKMFDEYRTFMALWVRWGRFWVRISAQVYLELDDYDWASVVLGELVQRVAKGEFKE